MILCFIDHLPAPCVPSLSPLGFVELSFASPPSPNTLPEHPQDLCTPQLRQLLTPIFNAITPPSSLPSSSSSSSLASSPVPLLVSTSITTNIHNKTLSFFFWFNGLVFNIDLSQSPCGEEEEEVMDTSQVEKFFAVWPEDGQQKGQTLGVRAEHP